MGRSDGKKLKHLDVEYLVAAHVMDKRTDAMNMIHLDIPVEPMRRYMNQKRKEGKRYNHLTLIIAAMVRAMSQYPALNRFVVNKRIYARNEGYLPQYIAQGAELSRSLITEGCVIEGSVTHSIISTQSVVEKGATVIDSVLMPGVHIGPGARVVRSIIAENAQIGAGAKIGQADGDIAVVGINVHVPAEMVVPAGTQYEP